MKTLLVALNAHYMHTNLGLRQIMLGLEHEDVHLYEAHINLPFRQILESIARQQPGAVGFAAYIWNSSLVWRLCRALKRAMPHVVIFAGGPEADSDPELAFSSCDGLDYVLRGEGEQTVGPFLKALREKKDPVALPGVWAMRQGKLVGCAPPAPLAPENWPDVWSGDRLKGLENRILYVETSRGCPYRCAYCLSSIAGPVRALEAGEAVRRLTHMAEKGAKLIKLVDRTFNFDRRRANVIWQGLIDHAKETGLSPRYHFEIGAHLLDEEAFSILEKAPKGLFQFEAGIQSTDPEVLAAIGRPVPFDRLAHPLSRVQALGTIPLHTDLIAALPGESLAIFARSFDQAWQVGAEQLQLGFLKLLPGSPLRLQAGELGVVYEPDPPYEALGTPQLSFQELCLLKDVETVVDWYHNSGRYSLSLRYLMESRSPFAFFEETARRLRRAGALEVQQKERNRAGWLLTLYGDEALEELMAHDLLSRRLGAELPRQIAFTEDEELRTLLRSQFHPVRGQRARRYRYDVLAYERGLPLTKKETLAVYP